VRCDDVQLNVLHAPRISKAAARHIGRSPRLRCGLPAALVWATIAPMPQLELTSIPIHGEYRKRGDKID
jgi:hypothetical protein